MTAGLPLPPIVKMAQAASRAADEMFLRVIQTVPRQRCRHCRSFNDEVATYCAWCGGYLPNADVMEHFGPSVVQFGETTLAVRSFSVAGVFEARAAERASKEFKLFAEHPKYPPLKCTGVRIGKEAPGLFCVTLTYQ